MRGIHSMFKSAEFASMAELITFLNENEENTQSDMFIHSFSVTIDGRVVALFEVYKQ